MPAVFHHWPLNKRAARVCSNCRARKVRCNVEQHGAPCENCQSDGSACILRESRRGKWASKASRSQRRQEASPNLIKTGPKARLEENRFKAGNKSAPLLRPVHTLDWLPSHARKADKLLISENFEDSGATLMENMSQPAVKIFSEEHEDDHFAGLIHIIQAPNVVVTKTPSINTSPGFPPSLSSGPTQADLYGLPAFIKPLNPLLASEDREYLWIKGALRLPPASLRRSIVAAYVQSLHPFYPLLDLSTFLSAVFDEEKHPRQQISILLFQAVMFAAVALVDLEDLQSAGFASRKLARKIFYDRVCLLYELDVETDRLTNIQSLILMSQYTETPGDAKGSWHWMGVAHSLALTLGLNRELEYGELSRQERNLRRRIWWSCYIRDRLIALSMCRATRIREDQFDTSILTADDFDYDHPGAELKAWVSNSLGVELIEPQPLAERSANMVHLCQIIGDILSLHFSLLSQSDIVQDPTGKISPMLFLRSPPAEIASLSMYYDYLESWHAQLPPSCIHRLPESAASAERSRTSILHTAILSMLFSAAVLTLYRPALHQKALDHSSMHKQLAEKRLCEAADRVSRINRDLHALHLDGCLPTTMVTIQLPVIGTFMARLQSSKPPETREILDQTLNCLHVLEMLRQTYHGADMAVVIVQDLMKRAKVTAHIGPGLVLLGLTYKDQSRWLDSTSLAVREAALSCLAVVRELNSSPCRGQEAIVTTPSPATETVSETPDFKASQSPEPLPDDNETITSPQNAIYDPVFAEVADAFRPNEQISGEQLLNPAMEFDMMEFLDFDWPAGCDDLGMDEDDSFFRMQVDCGQSLMG